MALRIKISEKLNTDDIYLFALGIYLVFAILNTSLYANSISKIYKEVLLLSIALLMLREVMREKISLRRVVVFISTSVPLMMLILFREEGAPKSLLTIIVFAITASDIDFDKVAKVSYVVIIMMLCFITLSSKVGLVEDYVYVMGGRPRHYLGFLYTLQPAGLMMETVMLNLFLHRNDKRNYSIIFLMLCGCLVFYYTRARLTFFFEILIVMLDLLFRIEPRIAQVKFINVLEIISFPLMMFISMYLSLTYKSNPWKLKLNEFLSNRLALANNSIMKYGIGPFGKNISWYGLGLNKSGSLSLTNIWTDYDWVDNAYVQALQLYGYIVCAVLLVAVTVLIYYLIKRKHYYLALILSIYSIHGFIDTAMLTLFYNVFWLVLLTGYIENPHVRFSPDDRQERSRR